MCRLIWYYTFSIHGLRTRHFLWWCIRSFTNFGLSRELQKTSDGITVNPMGLAGFSGFIEKVQGKYVATHHHCTNTDITFAEDGQSAFAKTYATNYHFKKDGTRFNYYGVYEDDMVKTDKGWRIKARKQFPLFIEGTVAPDE